jgi:hypothetical protein
MEDFMKWIDFPDSRLAVNGLAWWEENKPELLRLPRRLKDTFRSPVWNLAHSPAGGRIRFRTNSMHIGIRAECAPNPQMQNMNPLGQYGFDIYADGLYKDSVAPYQGFTIDRVWDIADDLGEREIVIGMPLYNPVTIKAVGLDDGASLSAPAPFALEKPVVFYGSSETQGASADTPGTAYQGFLSRWLNIDFINLGFNGQGLGDIDVACAINEIDSSCIVLDHWGNTGYTLKENLPVFVEELRRVHPETPILVLGAYYTGRSDHLHETREFQRTVARSFVRKARAAGDANIHFSDLGKVITPETAFMHVDYAHCSPLGFYFIAKSLVRPLKSILNL